MLNEISQRQRQIRVMFVFLIPNPMPATIKSTIYVKWPIWKSVTLLKDLIVIMLINVPTTPEKPNIVPAVVILTKNGETA